MKEVVRLQSQLRNEGVRRTQGSSIGNSYNFIYIYFFLGGNKAGSRSWAGTRVLAS